ncbi:MAG: hypothetical protein KBD37_01015 [Burkholderiales bacterium]|nr:hypothetical protein [Burkholderiales bacterium]
MKKLLYLCLVIYVVILQTCAITFSGKQDISYIVHNPVLSHNTNGEFESITLKQSTRNNSQWFNDNQVARHISESPQYIYITPNYGNSSK